MVAEQLTERAQLSRRDVGLGEQIGAQQVGERARIDGVGLHPRGGDRLRVPRMGRVELDPLTLEQVCQPLPPESGLERDPRLPPSSANSAQRLRSFLTRRESSSRPSSSKAATCEVLRCRSRRHVHHGGLLSDPGVDSLGLAPREDGLGTPASA